MCTFLTFKKQTNKQNVVRMDVPLNIHAVQDGTNKLDDRQFNIFNTECCVTAAVMQQSQRASLDTLVKISFTAKN